MVTRADFESACADLLARAMVPVDEVGDAYVLHHTRAIEFLL